MRVARVGRRVSRLTTIAALWILAAAALLARAAPTGGGRQDPQPPPQQPVFRVGVELVRVDVSVMGRDGRPVADLQASDFQILEDDVPQKVETVQFLRLDGQPVPGSDISLPIRSREHAEAEAARDDVRIFAIFLDDYHVDKQPSITLPLRDALARFVDALGPTDLVTVMEPLTPLSALEFTRSRDELRERMRSFEGRRGQLFPVKSLLEESQLTQRNIGEIRAEVTLTALTALASYLGGLREGRKSILFVTQGPPVNPYRGDQNLRVEEILEAANRGNVTINVLDPRRLGAGPMGGTHAQSRLTRETGGRLIVNTNDPTKGLMQIVEDASAYYLVGYSPAREYADGKFHRIEVQVDRPGVRVLARRGYWAPTRKERTDASVSAAPPVPGLLDSLSELAESKRGRSVDTWVGFSRGDTDRTRVIVTWEPAVSTGSGAAPVAQLEVEPLETDEGPAIAEPRSIANAHARERGPTVATFDLVPGRATLRFTARDAGGTVLDRWSEPVTLPPLADEALALATPRFLRARSAFEYRALTSAPDSAPEASRRFRPTDRVLVEIVCYHAGPETADVAAQLLNAGGQTVIALAIPALVEGRARIEIPVASLAQGTYVFRVQARAGERRAEQLAAFRIVP